MDYQIHGCTASPCMFEHALRAVTLPVFIQDQKHLLFANPVAVATMGAPVGTDVIGRDVNDFMHADSVAASEERRRLALRQGTSLRSIPVKGRMVDGTIRRAVTDGERIVDAADRAGIVHLLREVDGRPLMTYRAPASEKGAVDRAAACLHEAAFEHLAVPLVLHDGVSFLAVNAQARRVVGGDPRGLDPSSLTHHHSKGAARERRELTLVQGHTLRDVHVKLNPVDRSMAIADPICVTVDGTPIDYDGKRLVLLTVKDARA